MQAVVTSLDGVTPAWLTVVLQRHGQHTHIVQHIKVTHTHDEQLHSISYRFEAQWLPEAPAALPTHFFLKLPRQRDNEGVTSAGAREVAMYQFLAAHADGLPVIPCYDAVYDANQRRYHLLLADLTDTHDQPAWHLDIGETYVQRTVDCLAQLHAYWWGRTEHCQPIAALATADQVAADVQALQKALPGFLAALEAECSAEETRLFTRLVAAAPRLWARRLNPSNPTLVHGDAHFWNFLYPRIDTTQPTSILDWQQQHIDWGVSDLAYMLGLRYPHRTAANEYAFVQRYHAELVQRGIAGYAWQACWNDYRRAIVEQALIPIYWYACGLPEPLWRLVVPRAIAAYHDAHGAEIIDAEAGTGG